MLAERNSLKFVDLNLIDRIFINVTHERLCDVCALVPFCELNKNYVDLKFIGQSYRLVGEIKECAPRIPILVYDTFDIEKKYEYVTSNVAKVGGWVNRQELYFIVIFTSYDRCGFYYQNFDKLCPGRILASGICDEDLGYISHDNLLYKLGRQFVHLADNLVIHLHSIDHFCNSVNLMRGLPVHFHCELDAVLKIQNRKLNKTSGMLWSMDSFKLTIDGFYKQLRNTNSKVSRVLEIKSGYEYSVQTSQHGLVDITDPMNIVMEFNNNELKSSFIDGRRGPLARLSVTSNVSTSTYYKLVDVGLEINSETKDIQYFIDNEINDFRSRLGILQGINADYDGTQLNLISNVITDMQDIISNRLQFIMAPPASGKTTFIKQANSKGLNSNLIDFDDIIKSVFPDYYNLMRIPDYKYMDELHMLGAHILNYFLRKCYNLWRFGCVVFWINGHLKSDVIVSVNIIRHISNMLERQSKAPGSYPQNSEILKQDRKYLDDLAHTHNIQVYEDFRHAVKEVTIFTRAGSVII